MLVRTAETLHLEIKKRIGYLQAYLTRGYRGYDRLKKSIETMTDLWHEYRKTKRKGVNLWV